MMQDISLTDMENIAIRKILSGERNLLKQLLFQFENSKLLKREVSPVGWYTYYLKL
jgi:hypothetical protein